MYKLKHLNHTTIDNLKDHLLNFSRITEHDIRNIWKKPDEEYLDDFSKLVYSFYIPLYQKMIFRYRNGGNSAPMLYKGCDPCNQYLLGKYFGLCTSNSGQQNASDIIEFMAWLKSSAMICKDYVGINKWKVVNEIELYFMLTGEQQNNVIDMYNKKVIDGYNEMTNTK